MILKYYKHNDLKYASRKRILNIDNYLPFAEEIQYKVLLGDGAKTSIKTKTENICDYVTIEDTRWFVYDHIFMNGGQVTMHLIRDVIGEFGLDNCFGKIERGVTNSLLKYRKELGLNQILKDRKKIYPDTKRYAMVETNSHNEEMWGVLYFVKPKEEQTFNIPNLEIEATTNLTYNPDGIEIITNRVPLLRYTLYFRMEQGIDSIFSKSEQGYKAVVSVNYSDSDGFYISSITTEFSDLALNNTVTKLRTPKAFYGKELDAARVIAETMINNVINGSSAAFTFPAIKNVSSVDYSGYNNGITKDSEKFYRINVRSNIVIPSYGRTSSTNCDSMISEGTLNLPNSIDTFYIREVIHSGNDTTLQNSYQNYIDYYYQKVSFTEIGNVNQGTFLLDYSVNYVDEPFVCKVIPLYDCQLTIYNSDNTVQTANKNISKTTAFKVFNDIIAVTSGENPYLVDAQIYPYCPDLLNSPQDVEGIPVFDILSTTYIRNCSLLCNSIPDVKKDYICRELSIISPDQSNKYDFNYYDYSLEENIEIKGNENIHPLICQIKTALKPYNIISSFVIIPENGSLKNMSYSSDLRGSQPTGSGFETTLVTDQFQQYVRNNSNYNNMFELQKQELQKQHEVERKNERTSQVVNTLSATMMGAIGGGSIGGKIGAGVLSAVAGATVGIAMNEQYNANEELRKYEEQLLQQRFDLEIGTIKNLPNSISRISSYNNILMEDFCYVLEIYECSDEEISIVEDFISRYAYELGIYGLFINYAQNNNFVKGRLITSLYDINLHNIAQRELGIGIYYLIGETNNE